MNRAILAVTLAAVLGCVTSLGAAPQVYVGEYRNADCWLFEGEEFFTPEDLADKLGRHIGVAVASHPLRPLEDYMKSMETVLRLYYQASGFRDAEVIVLPDTQQQKLIIRIVEGERSVAGGLQFEGMPPTIKTELFRRFTEVSPESGAVRILSGGTKREQRSRWILPAEGDSSQVTFYAPIWIAGEGISYGENAMGQQRKLVAETLADHGYLNAKFDLEFVPAEKDRVDLRVNVSDLGPLATVGEVVVEGNEQNSADAILETAGIERGKPLNRYTVERAYNALRRSARFARNQIAIKARPETNAVDFSIVVVEIDGLPLLTEPLLEEAVQMLKLCEYMSQLHDDDGDLAIDLRLNDNLGNVELVVSATKGWLLRAGPPGTTLGNIFSGWLMQTPDEWGIALPDEGRKLILTNEDYEPVRPKMSLSVGSEKRSFSFGFYVNQKSSNADWIPFDIAPSLVASFAYADDFQYSREEKTCRAVIGATTIEFDAETGRPSFLSCIPKEMPLTIDARLTPGAFEKRLAEFTTETEPLANQFDAAEPIRSSARFFLQDSPLRNGLLGVLAQRGNLETQENGVRIANSLLKLLEEHSPDELLKKYDRVSKRPKREGTPRPSISDAEQGEVPAGKFGKVLGWLLISQADEFCEPGSTSWTALRFTGMRLLGMQEDTRKEMAILAECCRLADSSVMAALPLLLLNWPDHSIDAAWVDAQLQRLMLENFRRDYRQVLNSDRAGTKLAMAAIDWFRKTDLQDVEALSNLITDSMREAVVDIHKVLNDDLREESTADILSKLLESYWTDTFEPIARERLVKARRQESVMPYPSTGKDALDIEELRRAREQRDREPTPEYPRTEHVEEVKPAQQKAAPQSREVLPEGSVTDEFDDVFFPEVKK